MSPILRTSNTIYREASKVFFEEACFRFHPHNNFFEDSRLPTIDFSNESFRQIQYLEIMRDLTIDDVGLTTVCEQKFTQALRCFLERGCPLKTLDLHFNVGNYPQRMATVHLDGFKDLILGLEPKLERFRITIRHCWARLPYSDSDYLQRRWSTTIGLNLCSVEEREGFLRVDDLQPYNKIPTWTFRPLRHQAPGEII